MPTLGVIAPGLSVRHVVPQHRFFSAGTPGACARQTDKATSRLALQPLRYGSVSAQATGNGSSPEPPAELKQQRPVVVWFKHDLRTADNPGLSRALASGRPVIAFFCFDSTVLSDQATMIWGPEAVRGAVLSLRERLGELGCPLILREGSTAAALLDIVAATGAESIYAEDEVEERWLRTMESVKASLPPSVTFKSWRASIWQAPAYVSNFKQFVRRRGAPQAALPVPLPNGREYDAGSLDLGEVPDAAEWDASLRAAAAAPFASVSDHVTTIGRVDEQLEEQKGVAVRELGDLICGGEASYLDLLEGYLRTPEGACGRASWKRVQEVAQTLESIPGNAKGSFSAIFQPAFALGIISRRTAYLEAVRYEAGRNGGRFPVTGFATPLAKAAASAAECGDYHAGLAHLLAPLPTQADGVSRRWWRWNGQITDYLVAEPAGGAGQDAQSILLVHGFGACAEHWRRNITDLASRGFRVYACSLPGFGPSEKSPQLYTTTFWAAFIRDFIVNVVQAPVVVAGNSIGGGIPAFAAANHAHLFTGVVLLNTAGSIDDTPWDPETVPVKKTPNRYFVELTSRLVYAYLQQGISKQLQRLYPARPYNADKWLNDDIYRASCDPCALQVLQSGFYLPPPTPLPHLLGRMYKGPVLVLQGVLDPLNDAKGRALALEQRIPNASAVCIDAGHCPHDECPDLVNDAIAEFVSGLVRTEAPTASAR